MGYFVRNHARERPDAHRPDILGATRHNVHILAKLIHIIPLNILRTKHIYTFDMTTLRKDDFGDTERALNLTPFWEKRAFKRYKLLCRLWYKSTKIFTLF